MYLKARKTLIKSLNINRLIGLTALLGLVAAIFIGGTIQGAGSLFPPPWDKLAHIITFGIMFLISTIAFPKTRPNILFLLILIIGMADEIHQIYIPGRSPGLDDFIADFFGAGLGVVILKLQACLNEKN